jgi:DNA modification methylase
MQQEIGQPKIEMIVMSKVFAPDYPRTDKGWIDFPSDVAYRRQVFPEEANKHAAKANVYLVQAIIEYVSEFGDTLIDIMSGTGTLMIGALVGRTVICVEISQQFHEIQKNALLHMETIAPGISDHVMLLNMPCQTYLPIPNLADHIIFSPPYASIMKSKGKDKLTQEKTSYDVSEYTFTSDNIHSSLNIGMMNDFIWKVEMERIYAKCYDTIKPGGTMTLITKDHMYKRARVPLTQAAVDACIKIGFELFDWQKWNAPGSVYTSIHRSRGWEVVDDEDITFFRKGVL